MRYLAKKKYHLEEEESEGSWAVSYGDMITLLLSFFVIFFTTDLKKDQASDLNQYMSFSMEELKMIPAEMLKTKSTSPKVDLKGLDIQIHQFKDKVIVSFGRFSFFRSGQTELRPEGAAVLAKFVEKYLPYAGTYSLSIKGFTDRTRVQFSPNKKYRDNLELSALRSISAMRALQKSGIPLNRMEIAGAGELNLIKKIIADPKDLTAAELNDYSRTIMIVISPEKESWL
jgi:flagellar motor protein MotB